MPDIGYQSWSPSLTSVHVPFIHNVTLDLANTEYVHVCTVGIKAIMIKPRNPQHLLKIAWAEGESDTNYISFRNGCYWADKLGLSTLVIFLQSPDAGCVVEIEHWI